LTDRKAGEGLRSKWLIEFSEFTRINRATVDIVKAFVTRRSDHYRPPYGRIPKDFPRTCFFVGSTNDDHPFHDQQNRRFMPIQCNTADPAKIASNRDQLWAEAVSRYRAGEKWWVTNPTLLDAVSEKQEDARQADHWEEVLREAIGHMQTIKMSDATSALKLYNDRVDRSAQTRIGLALKRIGYTRQRVGQGKDRAYVWTKDEASPSPPF
jgi:predicted P-loop ATPase